MYERGARDTWRTGVAGRVGGVSNLHIPEHKCIGS